MRYYILEDLVSPVTEKPLRVDAADVIERDGPFVGRCVRWCGLRGTPADTLTDDECRQCASKWIEHGALTDGDQKYPIINGIPRFVKEEEPAVDVNTQESFGYEWQHFDAVLPDYDVEVENYFGIVSADVFGDAVVLDAGCGMGRWARQVAKRPVRRLYAIDFSRAIDVAARTLRDQPRVHCIQADVCNLPLRSQAVDFTYCLGVLHHLKDPDAGMRGIARVTAGSILVYLYYALDNRPAFHRVLLKIATGARWVTARLPKRAMFGLSWIIAGLVYWPLARFARVLDRVGLIGLAHQIPLSHYRNYSFRFMAGDAFDRFATPIENRYSRAAIADWLGRYGRVARFSNRTPFWVSLGIPKK
jgi:SAM-dependent methyltransferase